MPTVTSGRAIASLILGLSSLICNILTGIPAIILGFLGLTDIGQSKGRVDWWLDGDRGDRHGRNPGARWCSSC